MSKIQIFFLNPKSDIGENYEIVVLSQYKRITLMKTMPTFPSSLGYDTQRYISSLSPWSIVAMYLILKL